MLRWLPALATAAFCCAAALAQPYSASDPSSDPAAFAPTRAPMSYGPSPPQAPISGARPASWPGGSAATAGPPSGYWRASEDPRYAQGGYDPHYAATAVEGKGGSPHLCEAPGGPFRQMGTVPFSPPQPAGPPTAGLIVPWANEIPKSDPPPATSPVADSHATSPPRGPAGAPIGAPDPSVQPVNWVNAAMPAKNLPSLGARIEGTEILVSVANDPILARDFMLNFDEIRQQYKEQIPPEALESQLAMLFKKRLAETLPAKIENKLIFQHAQRHFPAEQFNKIKQNVVDQFEKTELPGMMKRLKVGSRQEMEEKLRATGMSIESQRREFVEMVIAHEWLRQQVKIDEEVGPSEMHAYYREHPEEFERPGRVRWEELSARTGDGGREAAEGRLAEMGNRVLRGQRLADVAKSASQGPTAAKGGFQDWTTKGTLVSKELERAVFGLPVGALSPIIDDGTALYIVRVLERDPGGMEPYREAQVKIREKIRENRRKQQKAEFLAKVRAEIPVVNFYAETLPAPAESP